MTLRDQYREETGKYWMDTSGRFTKHYVEWVEIKLEVGLRKERKEARECLTALSYWNDKEFKNGMSGHTLKSMRPMILTKKFLNKCLPKQF